MSALTFRAAGLLVGVFACLPAQVRGASTTGAKPAGQVTPIADEVCVGLAHTCARTSSGDVACWGDNEDRQVAPTDEPQIETPRRIREFPASVALRCGSQETCVRTRAGDIYCLGGSRDVEKLALKVPARDLVLHSHGGCALLEDGRVMCWQRPARFLPYRTDLAPLAGLPREAWEASPLRGATGFARASALADAVCVQRAPTPLCLRDIDRRESATALPVGAALASASVLLMPSYDASVVCGVLANHTIRCEGQDVRAVGFSALDGSSSRSAAPGGIVAVHGDGLCFHSSSKAIQCEGASNALVAGIPQDANTAALGDDHACAIVDGIVRCWGAASRGQLGNAGTYLHTRPEQVPGVSQVVDLDAGSLQACVVERAGTVFCWGARPTYAGPFAFDFVPTEAKAAGPALEVRAAGPGAIATAQEQRSQPLCVRRASGWWCLEKTWRKGRAVVASPLERLGVRSKNLARDLQCGIDRAGRLVCAGGTQRTGNRTLKTKLLEFAPGESFAEATSLFQVQGEDHVCGRTERGKIRCFSASDRAATHPVHSPTLEALANIVQVDAQGTGNNAAACALSESGSVWCWGDGRWGQLGNAVRPHDPFEAVPIAGLPPVARIAVGGTYVCARLRSGEIDCWGSHRAGTAPNGQLGERREAKPVSLPTAGSTAGP